MKMKKLILIGLSILLLVSIAGCAKGKEVSPTEEVSDAAKLLAELRERPESSFGELETFDLDNDGSEDKFVYTFETEEVAEDLFLERSLEFDKTGSELFEGKIVLRFENKGDKPIEYSHIEDIPKAFAESVDDLEFSLPPDEIIDPDPKVMWKGLAQAIEELGYNNLFLLEILWNPESSYVRGLTLEEIEDDFFPSVLQYCAAKCNKLSGTDRSLCLLDLVQELKGTYNPKGEEIIRELGQVCDKIEWGSVKGVCKALLKDDIAECNAVREEFDRDLCKAYVIESKCKDIEDTAQRENCIGIGAVSANCLVACLLLTGEDQQNLCAASVTNDKRYCEKIADKELRNKCLADVGEKQAGVEEGGACGGLGQPCCDCFTCDSGLTCDTDTVPYKCVECGGNDQPPCSICGPYDPTSVTCCEKKPKVEPCQEGLKACGEYPNPVLCRSCGCHYQKCCQGDVCQEAEDICVLGYCLSWHDGWMASCEVDSDCPCPIKKCVDGICRFTCGSNADCEAIAERLGYSNPGTCQGGVCR
jgi:hypothetical protein